MCLGMNLAIMEIKAVLALMVGGWEGGGGAHMPQARLSIAVCGPLLVLSMPATGVPWHDAIVPDCCCREGGRLLVLQVRHYDWKGLKHYELDVLPQPHTSNGPPLFQISSKADMAA
jgi:hypothetical protein